MSCGAATAEPENREFAVPVQLRVLLALLGGTLLAGGGTSPVHKTTASALVPGSLSPQGGKAAGGLQGWLSAFFFWKRVELHP